MAEEYSLRIGVESSGAVKGSDAAAAAMGRVATAAKRLDSSAIGPFQRMQNAIMSVKGALIGLGAGLLLRKMIAEISESQDVAAQLENAIRATGRAAEISSKAVLDYSKALQSVTTYSDEEITRAQTMLIRFDKLGAESIPRATKAVLDIASAMNVDLKMAALSVGKALQDPEEGLSALSRSGVKFTDQEKELLKVMVTFGKTVEATDYILTQIEKRFGGTAETARNTLGGAISALQNSFGDLLETVGEQGFAGALQGAARQMDAMAKNQDTINFFRGVGVAIGEASKAAGELFGWLNKIGKEAADALEALGAIQRVRMGGSTERMTESGKKVLAERGTKEMQLYGSALTDQQREKLAATRAPGYQRSNVPSNVYGVMGYAAPPRAPSEEELLGGWGIGQSADSKRNRELARSGEALIPTGHQPGMSVFNRNPNASGVAERSFYTPPAMDMSPDAALAPVKEMDAAVKSVGASASTSIKNIEDLKRAAEPLKQLQEDQRLAKEIEKKGMAERLKAYEDNVSKRKELQDRAKEYRVQMYPEEALRADLERLEEVQSYLSPEEYADMRKKIEAEYRKMGDTGTAVFDDLRNAVEVFGVEFTKSIATALMDGELQFQQFGKNILKMFAEIAIQRAIVDPMVKAFTGGLSSLGSSMFGAAGAGMGAPEAIPGPAVLTGGGMAA